ncbi:MAG TPA: response regulator [Actinomycetota bacterium]|nr:response regulator [Actinomycetota bacterium]
MTAQPIEQTYDEPGADGERITEMLATVSHELRTPAALIVGLASTLATNRDRMSSGQVTDSLTRLERQAKRLVRLLDDMLDVSKIKTGHKLDLAMQRVDLADTVEGAILASAPPSHVSVQVFMPEGMVVWSDQSALERAIVNLLRNAFKYGGSNVRVEARPAIGGVTLSVADDGPGVAPEIRQHLFKPYAASKGGTGLGLAIVNAVAEASGGEASYEPLVPAGSRFTMRLRDESVQRTAPHAADAESRKQPFLVLIVDDEPDVLFLLRMTLQHAGYEVQEAPHGAAALELIEKIRPDVIITDLMMPVVDGRELIRRVRGVAAFADLPIMLLSASPDDQTGADRVLRKPFDPRHLANALEELVGRKGP